MGKIEICTWFLITASKGYLELVFYRRHFQFGSKTGFVC